MQNIEAAARPTAHQASRFAGVNMDIKIEQPLPRERGLAILRKKTAETVNSVCMHRPQPVGDQGGYSKRVTTMTLGYNGIANYN